METNKEFSIIIPAAGMGKRMKSYGSKGLIILGETTILGRQLDILQDLYPKSDIVVVTGYQHERVVKYVNDWKERRIVGSKEIKIVENKRYEETNVAKTIGMATEFCNKEDYLIVYSDLVFNKETLSEIDFTESGVLLDTTNNFNEDEIGVLTSHDFSEIKRFCYGVEIKWSQIAFLLKNDMELFLELLDNNSRDKFFTFEIFNLMLDKIKLKPYYNDKSKIVEVDCSGDTLDARILARENL